MAGALTATNRIHSQPYRALLRIRIRIKNAPQSLKKEMARKRLFCLFIVLEKPKKGAFFLAILTGKYIVPQLIVT
jgi:hypothetical protein